MADFWGQRYGVIAEVQHQRFSAASQRDGPPLQSMERRGILPPVHLGLGRWHRSCSGEGAG